jgi:hypothetical protein
MSIKNSIRRLSITSVGSFARFLIMFILVVVGPLVLIVIGGYDQSMPGLASAWFFLAIALLLIVSIGSGFLMFRRKSDAGERSLYQP